MSVVPSLLLVAALLPQAGGPRGRAAVAEAERLAEEAVRTAARDPDAALARARRALALTMEFEPTAFVKAGRKGEVVEDEFQAARDAYGRHRAKLYEAVGALLAQRGDALGAGRYLRRAFFLDPTPDRAVALARALNALGRGREALDTVVRAIAGPAGLSPEAAEVVGRAADVAGLPSAQSEIDRSRLKVTLGAAVTLREGPLTLPPRVRLSTDPVVRIEDAPVTLIYAAEASCRSCSADLQELSRLVPKDVRLLMLPGGDDRDQALRQVLSIYHYAWPLLLGPGLSEQLGAPPRSLLLVARGGWTVALLKAPFAASLATAISALKRTDVVETVPRTSWNHRPVDRTPLPPPPSILPEGLAPGEDEPFPAEFNVAVAAFREGRKADAQKIFDALEAKGDGWLLPPEARLDRALCLAGTGQPEAARRLLLRTGDSRFEDAIDRLLEAVAAAKP
jgi:tetratricopeptide (TPR) repeat protein